MQVLLILQLQVMHCVWYYHVRKFTVHYVAYTRKIKIVHVVCPNCRVLNRCGRN